MRFRTWFEAVVSTENIGEAIRKTLEMVVEGDWRFVGGERRPRRSETEHSRVRLTGFLRNDKTPGEDGFVLTVEAEFDRSSYDSLTGDLLPAEVGESRKIKISCILQYGRKDFEDGVQVSSMEYDLGSRFGGHKDAGLESPFGGPLSTPMELGRWVKNMVENFKGFGGGDEDGEDEPEWSPSASPARLVGV
jgi:hypothetical protein